MTEGDKENARVATLVALGLLKDSFADLAAAFARVDQAAAGAAIDAIERSLADRLLALKQEFTERIGPSDHIMRDMITSVRDTIMLARKRIAEAANPH